MTTVRGALWLGALSVVAVAVYGLLVVVPYFVNGLDRFPLADVAVGYHDPKDLWPTTIPYVGGWLHLAGMLAMGLAPMTLVSVALVCGLSSVWAVVRRAWSVSAVHAVVAVACGAATTWFSTPFAEALAGWQMD
ncbi:hypothetical protein SAMN05660464_4487 [Geodermatophilus dictyosporus]|uniref:Uncharacterized protein n=1 Tax=Geodermatophilus dictyosporus TaxID=1523247 RepID=A0A1I5TS87_9ACTN|nr:hypothetical protein [Geodermatophilus dictyosporus]SFP85915.1 hypothetical protein SAMN05660464_4487 [Geodermatophilus dictyosporus]